MLRTLVFGIFLRYSCGVGADQAVDNAMRSQVTFLDAGTIIDYQPKSRHRGFFETDMRIYCYRGSPKYLTRFFESVELQLEIDNDEYTQYEGATPTEVRQHYEERRSLFSFNFFTQKRTRLHMPPFEQQCIGIDTVLPYRVRLQQFRIDYFRIIELVLGVSIFVFAEKLSHNSMFYYLTGAALGICSSFILIIWLCSKLMPRRPMMYGMLIGGWTLGVYIVQQLWKNLQLIFELYRAYVFWYILITGIFSFCFCYRIGPPNNQRSKNIIKWILQIMALTLIYLSSQYEEASITIVTITIAVYYFPQYILHKMRHIYERFFPPKRRLLTKEEYFDQGVKETAKALNDLRVYANSPDCKQWKLISKLNDPLRFAAFVEGGGHVREDEILNFEDFRHANEIDDTDSSAEEDEEMMQEGQCENWSSSYRRNEPYKQHQDRGSRGIVNYEEDIDDKSDGGYKRGDIAEEMTSGYNNKHTFSQTEIYTSNAAKVIGRYVVTPRTVSMQTKHREV